MSRVGDVCLLFVFAQRGKWEAPVVRPWLPDFAERHNRDSLQRFIRSSRSLANARHIGVLVWHITGPSAPAEPIDPPLHDPVPNPPPMRDPPPQPEQSRTAAYERDVLEKAD
jgi:hypothetical protein